MKSSVSTAIVASSVCLAAVSGWSRNWSPNTPPRELRAEAPSGLTRISGAVLRGETDHFIFIGKSGQRVSISITSKEKNAVFQLYLPGYEMAPSPSAEIKGETLPNAGEMDDATNWSGKLPRSGTYLVVIGPSRGNTNYVLTFRVY